MPIEGILREYSYGNWVMVAVWFVMFAVFVAFVPFHRKSQSKPSSIYVAFIVASALEMFGVPLSMYFLTYAFGNQIPRGFLWGHSLEGYIGYWGMWIGLTLNIIGAALIILGWRSVYRRYWSKERGEGGLVTDGIYAYSRHPQYARFVLMTLGLLVHWATLPLLVMWPILLVQYYRLAKREEAELEEEFGEEYRSYRERTPMFIPLPFRN